MLHPFKHLAIGLALMLLGLGLHAQSEDVDALDGDFKKPDPAQVQRLKLVLAEPVLENAGAETLKKQFTQKEVAARLLGDEEQLEQVLRQALDLVPSASLKNNLAIRLLSKAEFAEGNALMQQAVAEANPAQASFFAANYACALVDQYKNDAARKAIAAVAAMSMPTKTAKKPEGGLKRQINHLRALSKSAECLANLEQRFGRYAQATSAAQAAEQHARQALALAIDMDAKNQKIRLVTQNDIANAIARQILVYSAAGRLQDAENTLNTFKRLAQEVQLPPKFMAKIYGTAANLRFAQREFLQAERLARKSDQVLQGLAYPPLHPSRIHRVSDVLMALAGQQKWPQAMQALEHFEQLAGQDDTLKNNPVLNLPRGVVLYGNQRYAEAAGWFATMAQGSRQRNGDSHFFTAQASGLQGAALWHSGLPGHKSKALGLLKTAVQHYMLPANADFLENTGIRKELREAVFAAYLEALATSPGEDATQAIGAADWVRAGVVQEALNDAAVRAAASTPELSTVVRQEQDAKNEVLSLRRYLSGDAGAAESPLPGIANQMRARIGVLEAERVQLQAQIKAKFPDYERLVRPTALLPQDIARLLAPQQALLLILPTQQAVYVWAVAPDKPAGFARVALPQDQIKALVQRLRLQFDFNANPSAGTKFDNQAAFTLYDQLLAPLAGVWQGKSQLIVAAAGDLSQLPFGLLQTRVHEGFGSSAPWLINEASVTQVPSLSAWSAIKSIAKSKSATEVFSGWGDPDFGGSSATAAPSGGTSSRKIALTRASSLTDLEALDSPQPPTAALKYANIPTLPDTRVELMAIANSLKADTSHDLLLGKNATRQSVLAASQSGALFKKRVLAFATHGLMAGDLPHLTQPALALAASSADVANPLEPLLTLEDVLTLKLNADWVVLSACNTAAADGKAEEALSGLARGFFYAGSRSLLVTHWAVESESARLLTTATFAHYAANPQAPKAESLRQGMLSVMRMPDYQHPAFWAPYALVGDGGR